MLITQDEVDRYVPPKTALAIKSADLYADEVVEAFLNPTVTLGATLPWPKTHENLRFRPQEVSLWMGINGHGKSMMTSHVMLDFLFQGETVCIASFEMKPVATLRRMTRQALCAANPTEKFIKQFHQFLDGRLWLYDQQGTVDGKELLKVIRYCADVKGIKHFVVDSLMKTVKNEDDYNGQKMMVDELTSIARDHNIHIHLIHHSRKLADESQVPGKYDSKGSGSITDQVDQCFSVWRNKKKEARVARGEEDDGVDALLVCDKNRHGEWEGRIGLYFNSEGQYYGEHEGWRPRYSDRIDKLCQQSQDSLTNVVPFSAKSK
jgi:twinkle protein